MAWDIVERSTLSDYLLSDEVSGSFLSALDESDAQMNFCFQEMSRLRFIVPLAILVLA
jgi:hypothetical protein